VEVRFASALAVAAALVGCTTHPVLQAPSPYGDYGYRGGDGRVVRVLPFEDERTKPEDCAELETPPKSPTQGPNQPAAGAKQQPKAATGPGRFPPHQALGCSEDPPRWFAERLTTALQEAGFALAEDGALPPDALEIGGSLVRLEVEVAGSGGGIAIADSWLRLRVRDARGLSAHRSFYSQARSPGATAQFGASAKPLAQIALDASGRRAVRDMLAAVLSLSNRYPASTP
jgi:hypothetical protein